MKKKLYELAISVLVFAAIYYGINLSLQRQTLFPRPAAAARPPPLPPGGELVRLGESVDVEAFFLRPTSGPRPFPVLLFTHGNGELIDHWIAPFAELSESGIGVLLVEYPGYGRSGGSPSQESITATMLSAWDFLTRQSDVDGDRIVAYGRSLGGGAACALATLRPVAALVLESSFTSVTAIAARFAIPEAAVLDPFDNLSVVEGAEIPVLVIHGEHDQIIPVSHGEALARAAGMQLVRMPCGHNDCPRPWGPIFEFLAERGIVERSQVPSRFLGS